MEKTDQSLSVLCADVTGRVRLPRYLARTDALYAVDRCARRIRRSLESHGGHLVERVDGKLMAFFGGSVDALQAAIELQHRISDLPPYAGAPLAVRVGICTGHDTKEKRYFSREGANPAARLADAADAEYILLSVPKRMKRFPWSALTSDGVPDLALKCGKRQLGILRVAWQESDPVALKTALAQLGDTPDQLFLRHGTMEFVLDDKHPLLTIGRQLGCGITLRSTNSSRIHGTIERRLDRYVYGDRSSNGTYVTLEDQIEFFVHRKELLLFGHGQLSFGSPSSVKGAEIVRFQTSSFP